MEMATAGNPAFARLLTEAAAQHERFAASRFVPETEEARDANVRETAVLKFRTRYAGRWVEVEFDRNDEQGSIRRVRGELDGALFTLGDGGGYAIVVDDGTHRWIVPTRKIEWMEVVRA